MERPRFRPHFTLYRRPPDSLILVTEQDELRLQGALYLEMSQFLDGRPVPEVVEAMRGTASEAEVREAIEVLSQHQFLCEAEHGGPEAAFWSALGYAPEKVAEAMARARYRLVFPSEATEPVRQPLETALAQAGARPGEDGLAIVVVEDTLQEGFRPPPGPWLLFKPGGIWPSIGPLFGVEENGPCYGCLEHRLRYNRQIEVDLMQGGAFQPNSRAYHPLALAWACQHAVLELCQFWVSGRSPLQRQMLSLRLHNWSRQLHPVQRRPQCAQCGTPYQPDYPPSLESVPLTADDGQFRAHDPATVFRRYQHHIDPVTGLIPKIEPAPGFEDSNIVHVYQAGLNMARSKPKLGSVCQGFRMANSGKGTTRQQAVTGALCEALERYCGVFQGEEPRRRASLASLGASALHPNQVMLFSPTQYANRVENNKTCSAFHYVPLPFEEGTEIEWTPCWSLTRQEVRYLPTGYCFYNYPNPKGTTFARADSNGCASGSTLEEAILQGFFELVERDAVALWWYNQLSRPALDLASFESPFLARLSKFLEAQGRDYWVLDLTSDLQVPTFAAVSACREGNPRLAVGFGSHAQARAGMLRAVTEMNQGLAANVFFERQGSAVPLAPEADFYFNTPREQLAFVFPDPAQPLRKASDFSFDWPVTGRESVERCRQLVEARGYEFLILDQSRPDVEMRVAKVLVPGLRHFWPRYAPGRLYEVPVQLGWLERPYREDELNPTPIFW